MKATTVGSGNYQRHSSINAFLNTYATFTSYCRVNLRYLTNLEPVLATLFELNTVEE